MNQESKPYPVQPTRRKTYRATSRYWGVQRRKGGNKTRCWVARITFGRDTLYLGGYHNEIAAAMHWDVANSMIYGSNVALCNTSDDLRAQVPSCIKNSHLKTIKAFLRPEGQRILDKNPGIREAIKRWMEAQEAKEAKIKHEAACPAGSMVDGVNRMMAEPRVAKYSTDDILYGVPGRPGGMQIAKTTTSNTSGVTNIHYAVTPQGTKLAGIKCGWLVSPLGAGPSKLNARPSLWCRLKDIFIRLWRDEY